jgi:serine/threonine-protein kinase PknK
MARDATPSVDGYTDLQRIGHGGSSRVYRAQQTAFGRQVALKVLTSDAIDDENAARQFTREALTLGPMSAHPNIVTVLDAGTSRDGEPYIALELYERGTYAERVAKGQLPLAEVLRVGVKIASALETAHQQGLVHKDIKPENILISRFEEPALADFGVASFIGRETLSSSGLTIRHAAPEVLDDEPASIASDIYSLGSTLYTLLAGTPPFPEKQIGALMQRIMRDPPPPIRRMDLPAPLVRLVLAMLAKRPADRPVSAAEVARQLRATESGLGLALTPLAISAIDPAAIPSPPTATTPVGSTAVTVGVLDAVPPTNVSIEERDGGLVATWKHDSTHTFEYTTYQQGGSARVTTRVSTSSGVIPTAKSDERWCVSVVAILDSGERSQPSAPFCSGR